MNIMEVQSTGEKGIVTTAAENDDVNKTSIQLDIWSASYYSYS